MAEITHDAAEEGFHEIHLSGKQLVFAFMTATIVLVFIFLLGVHVGRKAPEGRGGEPAGMLAAAPVAGEAEAGSQAADPPTPPDVVDDLTYHRRLQGEDPGEPPKRTAETSPAAAPPPVAPPAQPAPQPTVPAATIASDVPTVGRPGKLVVQVFASQSAQAASSLVKRLAAKGYPAFLVPPAAGAKPPMYRVQVGRYNDRREAEEVSRRIAKEEQFNPWISSR